MIDYSLKIVLKHASIGNIMILIMVNNQGQGAVMETAGRSINTDPGVQPTSANTQDDFELDTFQSNM